MLRVPHTHGPSLGNHGTSSPHRQMGVMIALAVVAALAQLMIQVTSSDALYLSRWLVAMVFTLPGLLLAQDMTLRDLDLFQTHKLSNIDTIKLLLQVVGEFVLCVIAIPAVLELWFWA